MVTKLKCPQCGREGCSLLSFNDLYYCSWSCAALHLKDSLDSMTENILEMETMTHLAVEELVDSTGPSCQAARTSMILFKKRELQRKAAQGTQLTYKALVREAEIAQHGQSTPEVVERSEAWNHQRPVCPSTLLKEGI